LVCKKFTIQPKENSLIKLQPKKNFLIQPKKYCIPVKKKIELSDQK